MIIFISCSSRKKTYPCNAEEMYSESNWFSLMYKYAKSLNPSKIYILSAKYGLLKPSSKIEPYQKNLEKEKDAEIRKWSKKVYKQLLEENIDFNEEAIFLCGKNYRKYLMNLFKDSTAPLKHYGIGKQLAFLKEKVG